MRMLWILCLLIGSITCVPVGKDYRSNNAGTSFMRPPLSYGQTFSGEGMSSSPGSSSSLPSLSSPSFGKAAQLPAPQNVLSNAGPGNTNMAARVHYPSWDYAASQSSGYGGSATGGSYGGGYGSSASGYGGSATGGSYGGGYGSSASGYGGSATGGSYGGGYGSSASGYGDSATGGSYGGGYGSSASGYGDSATGGGYGSSASGYGDSATGGSYGGGYGSSASGYVGDGYYGYQDESSNSGSAISNGAGDENPEPVFSDVSDLEPVYSLSSRSRYQRGRATFAQTRYTPGEPVPPFPLSSSKATLQPNAPAKAPTKGGF